jgi:hypothetical protein
VAPITIAFGFILIVLGGGMFAWAGPVPENISALAFPAGFGLVLVVLGLLARTPKDSVRMHIMHAAVLVGFIGCLVPAVMAVPKLPTLLQEGQYIRPSDGKDKTKGVIAQTAMAGVCAVYVALCIHSFIQARRRRAASTAPSSGA